MKKQLFDLTIEEFTSVLLDYQPTLELSFCCYWKIHSVLTPCAKRR